MARLWRVYHPGLPAKPGAAFDLGAEEARHVQRVLRLKTGEPLAVFDGEGTEWRAVVVTSDRDRVAVKLDAPITHPVEPALVVSLYQGLCRPERMEWVIEKATEIGVAAIYPWKSRRAGPHAITTHRLARWRRIAAAACKQCGRRQLPRIEPCEELPRELPPATLGLVLDAGSAAVPLAAVCRRQPAPQQVWLVVGPGSGFEAQEVDAQPAAGWIRARLGPRVLRADTAGVIAASIVLHHWADLGAEPSC
jgi:16S rRNA (uracil1498-N3)-methyltransferase